MALITPITDAQAGILNAATPSSQQVQLGTELKEVQDNLSTVETGVIYALYGNITAAANSTAKAITVPFACEVIDVIVQCRAANALGTATLRTGTTAITDAIIMAVDKTIVRAGTIDDAASTLAAGDNLNAITNGAADRGLVTVLVRRTA
jgi:hypothetical protein